MRDTYAFPGMEYLGDGAPALQSRGYHQAERAHLTVASGRGPGLVRSSDCADDPVSMVGWLNAMRNVWRLPVPSMVESLLQVFRKYVVHHNRLYSERQPHESMAESGGPPNPLHRWVERTVDERLMQEIECASRSNYVDM